MKVTEPFLPPLSEYVEYLRDIWERKQLTNQGPLVLDFELRLRETLGTSKDLLCVANGGLGLQLALKALGVGGEVISTAFSFVATTSCPLWQGCSLRLADIDGASLTIDPAAVEAAITPRTEAILATHVFGNPCDVEALAGIASQRGLALIYDAAHAFDVTHQGRSILEYGDVSVLSLHATKLFHSVEGGVLAAADADVSKRLDRMRRFGYGQSGIEGVGINAKMSELHAAMGLCNLNHHQRVLAARQQICHAYDAALSGIEAVRFAFTLRRGTRWNYSYYPILCPDEVTLLRAIKRLSDRDITVRRYFRPSLDLCFPDEAVSGDCPVSRDVADRIVCLPLSASMTEQDVHDVASCLRDA